MTNTENTPIIEKDEALWRIAKKRAHFKKSLLSYIIVNCFLWAIWYFTENDEAVAYSWSPRHFPWPVWVMLGWGIGLAFKFAEAYAFPTFNSAENEYEKLKNKNK